MDILRFGLHMRPCDSSKLSLVGINYPNLPKVQSTILLVRSNHFFSSSRLYNLDVYLRNGYESNRISRRTLSLSNGVPDELKFS